MNIEIYIEYLKNDWYKLKTLPILTAEQIKDCNNDCIRMYLYCYYNYPEFYNYKKKKLLRYINIHKDNLLLFSAWCGHVSIVKYLILCGFDINYKNVQGNNAYMSAAYDHKSEMMMYLETTNINIYQCNTELKNACDILTCYENVSTKYSRSGMYRHIIDKIKYTGCSKICSICYEYKDQIFITCKNKHIVHLECQAERNKNKCSMCLAKFLI